MAQETVTIKKTTLVLVVSLIAVFAVGLIGGLAISGAFSNTETNTEGSIVKVTIGDSPFLGDPNAPLTLIEFADYQCPYCTGFTGLSEVIGSRIQAAFPEIKEQYIDTGKIKFVYKDFAFLGEESLSAAQAARCAGEQGKYWEYHDKLFTSWNGENQGTFSATNLKSFAAELNLDTAKFNSCVDSNKYLTQINQETQEASSIGVSGTPTFVLGRTGSTVEGILFSGALPFSEFKSIIDSQL